MIIFRNGRGRIAFRAYKQASINRRRYASRIDLPLTPPPFPVLEHCPAPTCTCRSMPENLGIEKEQNINGSMAAYAEQVLISTGRDDWKSKIEDDEGTPATELVRQLKGLMGRGGKYSDPYHNVLLTNSSFLPTESSENARNRPNEPISKTSTGAGGLEVSNKQQNSTTGSASAFLVPSFQYVPSISTDYPAIELFVRAFLLPSKIRQSQDNLSREQKNILLRQPELQNRFPGARKIDEILVLICGHGQRDKRCGTLGPILRAEFEEKIKRQNLALLHDAPGAQIQAVNTIADGYVPPARVGLISHIGGHKWAGNVIVYIPPSFSRNPLAGKGIWYGRVRPEHVEGIVGKTILDGKVIKELFRGGIDQNRRVIRL